MCHYRPIQHMFKVIIVLHYLNIYNDLSSGSPLDEAEAVFDAFRWPSVCHDWLTPQTTPSWVSSWLPKCHRPNTARHETSFYCRIQQKQCQICDVLSWKTESIMPTRIRLYSLAGGRGQGRRWGWGWWWRWGEGWCIMSTKTMKTMLRTKVFRGTICTMWH